MTRGRETDTWPFVQAKYFAAVPRDTPRTVRVIVIHDMEYPEKLTAAEEVAEYFRTMPDHRPASAHICVDADSIVQCVHDRDVAYAAPGCNHDGIQIELAGYGRQSRADWLDDYSARLLDRAANATAQYCVKFDIPPVLLTDEQLRAGDRGIVGHAWVSRVYRESDHTDPGVNFPWDIFMGNVAAYYAARL